MEKVLGSLEKAPGISWIWSHTEMRGKVGAAAFLVGMVVAVITGLFAADNGGLIALLVVLGLVVGFLNVTAREITPFLVIAIALVIIGTSNTFEPLNKFVSGAGDKLGDMVRMIAIFAAPAAVVQAIVGFIALAKPNEGIE